jgi:hypothetical protein
MSSFPPPPGPGTPQGGPFGPPSGTPPQQSQYEQPQHAPPQYQEPQYQQAQYQQAQYQQPQLTPIPTPTPTPGSSPPVWKKWWFAVGLLVVAGGIVTAIVVATSKKDEVQVTSDTRFDDITVPTFDVTIPDITAPQITIPDVTVDITIPSATTPDTTLDTTADTSTDATEATTAPTGGIDTDDLIVGQTATVEGGSTVRLNSITPNAPLIDDLFTPDEGNTITRLDIEGCAGTEGLYFNSLYWQGFAEDNTSIDSFLFGGDLPTFEIAPGACIRGLIDLEVPAGKTVSSVVMQGSLFQEAARWNTNESVPVDGPLVATAPITTFGLNETAKLPDGATAVVRAVTPNAPPLDDFFPPAPGRQLVRADVEVCAGTTPLEVGPIYWYVSATDSRTGEATFGGSTLSSIQLAAGECGAGLVELDLPADATADNVIITDSALTEAARFRVS